MNELVKHVEINSYYYDIWNIGENKFFIDICKIYNFDLPTDSEECLELRYNISDSIEVCFLYIENEIIFSIPEEIIENCKKLIDKYIHLI